MPVRFNFVVSKKDYQNRVVNGIKIFLNNKKRQYDCKRYKKLSDDEKQKLFEYTKK